MYNYKLTTGQLKILASWNISQKEFSVCFQTADTHSINDMYGFLPDNIFIKSLKTYKKIKDIERWLQSKLVILNLPVVRLRIEQIFRSEKTYRRLLREGLSPSKTSQHHRAEAGDIHFEYYDILSENWKELRYLKDDKNFYMGLGFTPDIGKDKKLQSNNELFMFIVEMIKMYINHLEIQQLRIYDWGIHAGFLYDYPVTKSISYGFKF